jgi:short-subunit dehydrogenase
MNIVITGASRGIGKELVKIFARNNNKIVIISRNTDKLNKLKYECENINNKTKILPVTFDLEHIDKIKELTNSIANFVSNVDILINNAGFLINKPFEEISFIENEKIYKINILAPITLISNLLPLFKKSKNAHIVNISSMGGFQGSMKFSGLASYASSKAAIASLTECLAEEYKDTNIKFNCLALGAVATEMLAEAFPGYQAETLPADMAEYIYNFATTGHKIFNGKILPVSNTTP